MAAWSDIKAYLQCYTGIQYVYSILCLRLLWCCVFHWSWVISVFLSCQFKLDTGLCGFCGQVSDLDWGWWVECAGDMAPQSEKPSLWAQRKLTRQAWVSQWHAPGRKLFWDHGRLSSCSCMTLTTATTREATLLLLTEVVLLWYHVHRSYRGKNKEEQHEWACI